jgi:hypothetical protein
VRSSSALTADSMSSILYPCQTFACILPIRAYHKDLILVQDSSVGWHPTPGQPGSRDPTNKAASSRIRFVSDCGLLAKPILVSIPVELLTDHPHRLPEWYRFLWHPFRRVFHKTPSFFKLHTWRLSGISSKREAFWKTLSIKCLGLKESRPLLPMTAIGLSSETGVGNTSFLRSLPLYPSSSTS